jgi:NAD(P)-dependent dehydrogenase (short-subunit alcohol dehydrogenase family)
MNNSNRVALVTGASSGIGAATARAFIERGFTVYAAARRLDRMQDLQALGAHVVPLDLTQADSIEHLADALISEQGRLDVLVNNAGYGVYGAVEDIPLADARRQFEVNLFGLADLTRRVLPMMRAARSGRVINITSVGGKIWSPFGAWYHATKFALEGFSDCLRMELWPFGIDVVVIEPGAIKTEWADIAFANAAQFSGQGPYRPIGESITRAFAKMNRRGGIGEPPRVVADAIVHAATVRRPRARYVAPFSARLFLLLRGLLGDRLIDRLLGAMFGVPKTLA